MSSAVFAALADPTRRHIVELLASRGSGTATALAGDLDISRQAVAKHLQLLQDAGLATATKVGRETRFEPCPESLASIAAWIADVESAWDARLATLATVIEKRVG